MEWFVRSAGMWAGPNGERELTKGGHGANAQTILFKIFTAEEMEKKPTVVDSPDGTEVEDKGKSGDEASQRALARLEEFGIGPGLHAELINRGWVLIRDEGSGAPMAMGKNLEDIVRVEDAVMQYLSKGPVLIAHEGAGSGYKITMEDIEATASFNEALELARSKASTGEAYGSFGDVGVWSPWKSKNLWNAS
jgi:hypothetical protein